MFIPTSQCNQSTKLKHVDANVGIKTLAKIFIFLLLLIERLKILSFHKQLNYFRAHSSS